MAKELLTAIRAITGSVVSGTPAVFVTGEANTSDATAETILIVAMEDDTTLQMQLWITGITDDGANSGSYALFIAYKKDGLQIPGTWPCGAGSWKRKPRHPVRA